MQGVAVGIFNAATAAAAGDGGKVEEEGYHYVLWIALGASLCINLVFVNCCCGWWPATIREGG